MGTRSLTHVYDAWFTEDEPRLLCTIYRQYDGYPSGHGAELGDFLMSKTLTNGISGDPTKVFNGPGDLAAQLVAYLKMDGDILSAGNIYIEEPGTSDVGEEFVYTITVHESHIHFRVETFQVRRATEPVQVDVIYDGLLNQFVSEAIGEWA